MPEIYLIGLRQSSQWKTWLKRVSCTDTYFLPEYAELWGSVDKGKSKLFVFSESNNIFLYPFKLRSLKTIGNINEFAGWNDITSDYGYGGPIISYGNGIVEKQFVKRAVSALDDVLKSKNIVSEFCRFHPLKSNIELVEEDFQPIFRNQTVWIDLMKPKDELIRDIRKNIRYDIRRAERNGVKCFQSERPQDVDTCHKLYLSTMKHLNADKYYYFNRSFFRKTVSILKNKIIIINAVYDDDTIASSMFMCGDGILHYHFSGMNREYGWLSPNKLILFKAILWAKENKFAKLHLGGGYRNGPDDPLMRFKAGFSKQRTEFFVAKRIHNPSIYSKACEAEGIIPEKISFFPAYRARSRG